MHLKIGIIGSRGIPNSYGGFEQFAEYLSAGLAAKGHKVYVYNSHKHPYQLSSWNDVNIKHCYDPEHRIGTMGQFVYDFNSTLDARKRNFDILFFLGYTSSSIWRKLYPSKSIIITNMDGLEWKRTKYSKTVRKFLVYAEKLAVKYSDFLVADSLGIQAYLKNKYNVQSEYIPYGAQIFANPECEALKKYKLLPGSYYMLMARMESENNVEMILDGFLMTNSTNKFVVIGNTSNKYGIYITEKYKNDSRIEFFGPIYNMNHINNLRYYSKLYFHGHSVGGTNPSLLEAMASSALIAAHDNIFNRSILGEDANYFSSETMVKNLVEIDFKEENKVNKINNNLRKIAKQFNWNKIISDYEKYFINATRSVKAPL